MAAVLALTACVNGNEAATDAPATTAPATNAPDATGTDLYDVSELAEMVANGVVSVTQEQVRLDFFGDPSQVPAGAGTGIVIDDGLILTNAHVIEGASSVTVVAPDGRQRQATVVASSRARDVALLKVEDRDGLQPLRLAEPGSVAVGDPAVAVGNALGLDVTQPTVSAGIVSAVGRTLRSPGGLLEGLVQTDAAINPGNSGGPLLNGQGEVIGVNTAILGGPAQNLGFAIGVEIVSTFIERFEAGTGEPFLGVSVVDNTPVIAERLDLTTDMGAVVIDVMPGSAADEAGFEQGFVITAIEGVPVETSSDVTSAILNSEPGATVEIELVTESGEETIEVTLGERSITD